MKRKITKRKRYAFSCSGDGHDGMLQFCGSTQKYYVTSLSALSKEMKSHYEDAGEGAPCEEGNEHSVYELRPLTEEFRVPVQKPIVYQDEDGDDDLDGRGNHGV